MIRRMKTFLAAGAVTAVFGSEALAQQDTFQPQIEPTVVARMEEGRALRRAGDYEDAIEKLKEVVEESPDYYLAWYNLGLAYNQAGFFDQAIESLLRSVRIKKEQEIKEATIYNSLGWTYLLAGAYPEAEEALQKGMEHADQLSEASRQRLLNNFGALYLHWGRFDDSRKYLELAKLQGSGLAEKNLVRLKTLEAHREHRQTHPKSPDEEKIYYVVVGAFGNMERAFAFARGLRERIQGHEFQVRKSDTGYFTVILGTPVDFEEGSALVTFARQEGIATDAYLRGVGAFGEPLVPETD